MKDGDAAMEAATYGDASLLSRWVKDPNNTAFGDVADFRQVSTMDTHDGMEDMILQEAGFSLETINKMSMEDKNKHIKKIGEDIYILTSADGTKHTFDLEQLASHSGYTSRISKAKQDRYSKASIAGGLKRMLSQALVEGDDQMVNKIRYQMTQIAALEKTNKTETYKPSAKQRDARFIAEQQNPGASEAELNSATAKIMEEQGKTAYEKKLDVKAEIKASGMDAAADITAAFNNGGPHARDILTNSKAVSKILATERDSLKGDIILKTSVAEFEGVVSSIGAFGLAIDSIEATDVTSNAFTKVRDSFVNMTNKTTTLNKDVKESAFWATDPNNKATYIAEADRAAAATFTEVIHKTAMFALIKAMSGLAVSDGERQAYEDLMGSNNLNATRKLVTAARAFIMSKRSSLGKSLSRLKSTHPATAALLETHLAQATTRSKAGRELDEKNAADNIVRAKAAEKAKAIKKNELLKNFMESMK